MAVQNHNSPLRDAQNVLGIILGLAYFTLMDTPNLDNKSQFHIQSLNVLLFYAITQLYIFLSSLVHMHILNLK
ncbi:hypothetical protein SAMN05444162_2014 [Paenibacillaceae bacterium GAS479]|nr:hypothetical protein SAMN05444162_2014 [Paenibacillaceae bacterium GAS479]